MVHIRPGIQLAKRAKTGDSTTLESAPLHSLTNEISARTFAVGLLHGTIQPRPGVNIPAVPLTILQDMARAHGLQTYLTYFVYGVLYLFM